MPESLQPFAPLVPLFVAALYQIFAIDPKGLRQALATRELNRPASKLKFTISSIEAVGDAGVQKNRDYLTAHYSKIFALSIIVWGMTPAIVITSLLAAVLGFVSWWPFAVMVLFVLMAISIKSRIDNVLKMK